MSQLIAKRIINGARVTVTRSRRDILFSCESIYLSEIDAMKIQKKFGYQTEGNFYNFECSNKKSDYFYTEKIKLYFWKATVL